jgi:hypothetical protein
MGICYGIAYQEIPVFFLSQVGETPNVHAELFGWDRPFVSHIIMHLGDELWRVERLI